MIINYFHLGYVGVLARDSGSFRLPARGFRLSTFDFRLIYILFGAQNYYIFFNYANFL